MNKKNPSVDGYLRKNKEWQPVLEKLRTILLDCQLTEEVKWRVPCYTFEGNNIVIIGTLKECCTFGFFKGALLKDTDNILVKPGENTQSARMVRFTNVQEIEALEPILKAYIDEAIEVEKAGLKVEFKPVSEFDIPEELQTRFAELPAFKAAFEALTPGRQKGYLLHFAAPKQSKTRESRIEKCIPQIFDGIGLNDRP